MGNPVDILLNDDFDLKISAGDFVTGDATSQHQKLLLLAGKGMFKQTPEAGVGVMDYILDDIGPAELRGEITEQFRNDGMQINKLTVQPDYKLTIDAEYTGY